MKNAHPAPWTINQVPRADAIAGLRWCVTHPRVHEHRQPTTTSFRTHAEALAFVLAQPEVRRRTSKPVDPLLRSADA